MNFSGVWRPFVGRLARRAPGVRGGGKPDERTDCLNAKEARRRAAAPIKTDSARARPNFFDRYNACLARLRRLKPGGQAAAPGALNRRRALDAELTALRAQLARHIERIPQEPVRCVMRMRYLCGMAVEDIAQETYYSGRHVERLMCSGRRQVAEYMKKEPP